MRDRVRLRPRPSRRCMAASTCCAIGVDLGQASGAVSSPRCGPRMARAERLVVGVEKVEEARVERPVARQVRQQHDRLEEPAGMGQVPLGRAGVRHRLHALVFGRERRGECQAVRTHLGVSLTQSGWLSPAANRRERLTGTRACVKPPGVRRAPATLIERGTQHICSLPLWIYYSTSAQNFPARRHAS